MPKNFNELRKKMSQKRQEKNKKDADEICRNFQRINKKQSDRLIELAAPNEEDN